MRTKIRRERNREREREIKDTRGEKGEMKERREHKTHIFKQGRRKAIMVYESVPSENKQRESGPLSVPPFSPWPGRAENTKKLPFGGKR